MLDLLIPYDQGQLLSRLHEWDAEILETAYSPEGSYGRALVREELAAELALYSLDEHALQLAKAKIAQVQPEKAAETSSR